MNPEVKARWVAALRSGEYRQAQSALRTKDGHCCLGVLCDLFSKADGRRGWRTRDLSDAVNTSGVFDGDPGMPGAVVTVWAELDPEKKVWIGGKRQELYNHNDAGATFAQIADAIEEQL